MKIKIGDRVKYSGAEYLAQVIEIVKDPKYLSLSSVTIQWLDNQQIETAYLEDLELVKEKKT